MKSLQTAFKKIEDYPITALHWIIGFSAVLFIRFLLENISNVSTNGALTSDASTLIHYYLFYLYIVLATGLVISWLSGKKIIPVLKLIVCALPVTWLPPVIDLVVTAGEGTRIAYFFQPLSQLWHNYLTYTDPAGTLGASIGVRIEVALVAIVGGWFVYAHRRGLIKRIALAILAGLAIYTIVFLAGAIPSLIAYFGLGYQHLPGSASDIINYLISSLTNSSIVQNFLHPTVSLTPNRAFEIFFNVIVGQVFYLVAIPLLAIIAWRADKKSFKAIIGNSRITRVLHYFLLITVGIGLAKASDGFQFNWIFMTSLITLYASFYFAWMYAVGKNDIADIAADAISNTTRPLASQSVSAMAMENYSTVFLILAIVGSFLVGHNTLFLILTALAASYIYTTPPIRLKRFPFISTFLIAIAGLCASMSGFLFWNADKTVRSFPGEYMILIVVGLTLAANVKDLKDIEGDKADGVMTIPTLVGRSWGAAFIGLLLLVTAGMLGLIVGHVWLIGLAVIIVALTALYFRHVEYDERLVFFLYFVFIGMSIAAYFLT